MNKIMARKYLRSTSARNAVAAAAAAALRPVQSHRRIYITIQYRAVDSLPN